MRVLLALLAAHAAMGQTQFPMKYLGEVGLLGEEMFDRRKFADLGFAKAFPDENGLRFEGTDHAGKIWRVWIRSTAHTEVWTADFDHNGQPDLLIDALPPASGHCSDYADITVLLFDATGRPVPWVTSTETPET